MKAKEDLVSSFMCNALANLLDRITTIYMNRISICARWDTHTPQLFARNSKVKKQKNSKLKRTFGQLHLLTHSILHAQKLAACVIQRAFRRHLASLAIAKLRFACASTRRATGNRLSAERSTGYHHQQQAEDSADANTSTPAPAGPALTYGSKRSVMQRHDSDQSRLQRPCSPDMHECEPARVQSSAAHAIIDGAYAQRASLCLVSASAITHAL